MGLAIPMSIFTVFWFTVGGVIPWLIPKGQHRGVIQTMLVTTAACCYLFWLCTILHQLNPLIGPSLENKTLLIIKREWQ